MGRRPKPMRQKYWRSIRKLNIRKLHIIPGAAATIEHLGERRAWPVTAAIPSSFKRNNGTAP
jgi:hypothetical protein